MLYAACDIGGTNTQAALIDNQGKISLSIKRPTRQESAKALLDGAERILAELFETGGTDPAGLSGLGVGVAGVIDAVTGSVIYAPNLPLKNIQVTARLAKRFGVPVILENDSTMAMLGETSFGAGKGAKNIAMMTIGTGIGGGFLCDGKPVRGARGAAGEIGHMVIDINGPKCRCGRQGCLEALAAGPAIAARARAILIKTPEPGYLMRLTGGDPKKITGEMVAKAAADGDPAAIRVMEETGRFIAAGCANIINLFDPQKVILGGGVMEGGELLLASVRRALKETRLTSAFKADDIVPAALGNQAGLAGAAALFGQR